MNIKEICEWWINEYPETEDETIDGSMGDIIKVRDLMIDILEDIEKG